MSAVLRLLIVSETISMAKGGEAAVPFFYAKLLKGRNVEVWLGCHERVSDELRDSFPDSWDKVFLVRDTWEQKLLYRMGKKFPSRIQDLIFGQCIHLLSQFRLRGIAKKLAREGKIDVVFEPTPITPKGISCMFGIGVPVVIGPLCGGLNYPPAFKHLDSRLTHFAIWAGRWLSGVANRCVPGKLRAHTLLVASPQTRAALPRGIKGRVLPLIDSGVDLATWSGESLETSAERQRPDRLIHFVYSGRFADCKGITYLVQAFQEILKSGERCLLDLIGDGDLFPRIEAEIRGSPSKDSFRLHGWVSRTEAAEIIRRADVFVMPSLRECGGNAILEAMAMGKPIIAANWGGPAAYVNPSCGILVEPSSPKDFVEGLANAMTRLNRSADLRRKLGEGGRARVREDYLDWDSKADRILEILKEAALPRETEAYGGKRSLVPRN